MVKNEAYFISHCDNQSCDLGCFEYTCPICNKTSHDYQDVWWFQYDILISGLKHQFVCENCCGKLFVYWDDIEMEYFVAASPGVL